MKDKKLVINSFMWTAIETYSTQGVVFIVGIIMARLLTPSAYGIIGIIGVFLAISETFVDSGFTNALIHKNNCSKADYNTVFIFNVVISIVFFLLLYIAAPAIASFYNEQSLIWTTRIMGVSFVISSLGAIPMTIITKNLLFRVKATISFIVSICSGFIGILLAYNGFGVWSLVFQSIISATLRSVFSIIYVKWVPQLNFSKSSFKELFGFGSKLLGSNLIFTIYNNLYSLVIGKVFSSTELGYFNRATGYSQLIPNNISGVINKFLFPVLTKIKNDDSELSSLNHKFLNISSYFIFPGCMMLASLATPLVKLMLTDKWMPVVPILQILCVGSLFDTICSINGSFILAKGRSDIFLFNHIITKPIGGILLVISIFGGIETVAWSKVFYMLICLIVSCWQINKILRCYSYKSFVTMSKILICSASCGFIGFMSVKFMPISWFNLIITILIWISTYLLLTILLVPSTFKTILNLRK